MSLLVDIEDELDMPGGVGFIDATDVLEKGAEEMLFGSTLSLEGFEFNDAMSALEIMDPRMDTGMTEPPPTFDPNQPLLPAEVCWILDRSFACEMSWHTGLALAQTVYTLRYVHHLGDITQPYFKSDDTTKLAELLCDPEDPERPIRLVTLVLRAWVFCLLKCCDLVWREIAHDHVIDGEDWNSEKYGVSLCENIQPESVLNLLDEALTWLQESPSLSSSSWRDPLVHRLLMRKNILQALDTSSSSTLRNAREHLSAISADPSSPVPSAVVLGVFDPYIARRLVSFIPTRVIELPSQSDVWEAAMMWLDQWYEIRQLIGAESLWCVKVLASLRAYSSQSSRRSTFLRSLSISTFFNGSKILGVHGPPWLLGHFFSETAAISLNMLSRLAAQLSDDDSDSSSRSSDNQADNQDVRQLDSDGIPSHPSIASSDSDSSDKSIPIFERGLVKLLVDYFTSFYHNRARQRRKLAASLLDWHLAFEQACDMATSLSSNSSLNYVLSKLPLCIRHVRLLIITEVICSGFELELYARHEWTMMYWYLCQVLGTQVALMDEVKVSLLREFDNADAKQALVYASFQRDYACALRFFAIAIRNLLCRYSPSKVALDPAREQANFEKRFKWAFVPGYSEASTLDEDRPVLGKWRRWRNAQDLHEGGLNQALESLHYARDAFLRLSRFTSADSGSVYCKGEYTGFMLGLARACDANLAGLQNTSKDDNAHVWKWEFSRWFPQIDKL